MSNHRPDAGKAGTTYVSFVCQKCHQPLKLDTSFANLDPRLYNELTTPARKCTSVPEELDTVDLIPTAGHGDKDEATPGQTLPLSEPVDEQYEALCHRVIPAGVLLQQESGNDFTLIGQSAPTSGENLSVRLKVAGELFDILSGESEVDHPLCEECTDCLLDQLDQQLKITEDECRDYRDFLEKLSTQEEDVDLGALEEELRKLESEEQTLKTQLESIEVERGHVQAQIQSETERAEDLRKEEEKYYKEYNEYKRQLLEYEEAQRSVDNQLKYAKTQLDKLKKTNVFNATFHIWHRGHFGTINNFRLGRLPSVPVDWHEINAAWGQTVLLLHSLANKMNLKFERYRLVPYGNHSFLECLSDKSKELPLYGYGGFRFFWDTKFDQAMVAFLDCLQQFKEEVERGDSGFSLPYKMEKGRIEDSNTATTYSIKIQFNSEEQWTKALKFMLTNLKWGLAWVSSQFGNK